jgi:hypothetical protein
MHPGCKSSIIMCGDGLRANANRGAAHLVQQFPEPHGYVALHRVVPNSIGTLQCLRSNIETPNFNAVTSGTSRIKQQLIGLNKSPSDA